MVFPATNQYLPRSYLRNWEMSLILCISLTLLLPVAFISSLSSLPILLIGFPILFLNAGLLFLWGLLKAVLKRLSQLNSPEMTPLLGKLAVPSLSGGSPSPQSEILASPDSLPSVQRQDSSSMSHAPLWTSPSLPNLGAVKEARVSRDEELAMHVEGTAVQSLLALNSKGNAYY